MAADTHPDEGYEMRNRELAKSMAHGKYWRRALYAALAMLGCSMLGNVYLGALPKWKPKYIEIDTCGGDVRVVGDAPLTYTRRQITIAAEVKRFVKDIRGISLDIERTKEQWRSLEARVTPDGRKALFQEQETYKPLAKRGAVWVQIMRAMPRSGTTTIYDVRWKEETYNDKRELIGVASYSGLFSFVLRDPATMDELQEAAAGVFLHEWHYAKEAG
jgi:type IV secretion system protein VirB5